MARTDNILLIGLLIFVVGGFMFTISSLVGAGSGAEAPATGQTIQSAAKFETKTSKSRVSIDLTPKEFKDGKFYVDIGVNTHSIELSEYDLKEILTLEIDGKQLSPVSAPEMSWHHNSGTLVFEVDKEPKNFGIVVKNLPDIEERRFEWRNEE